MSHARLQTHSSVGARSRACDRTPQLAQHFGRTGHAHLRSQLTRAGDSIAANIVEGCGAESAKDFARFLEMSVKSANEAEYHLLSARDLSLISPEEWQTHTAETIAVRKMVCVYGAEC